MSHTTLTVVIDDAAKNKPGKRQREAAIDRAGGLHFSGGQSHRPTAIALSKLPWVERVVATYVTEVHVGTWRKGELS